MHLHLLTNLRGLFVLTGDGQLGVYDSSGQFQADAEVSAALREHNLRLLKSYLADEAAQQIRIALVHPTYERRPWKSETLFFEERVVRQLYPVGAANASLTAFQKRNQERSFYRGVECLLHSRANEGSVLVYCPVLFDRGRTLDMYLPVLGRSEKEGDAKIPVIEVLNLVATIPAAERDTPMLRKIEQRLCATLSKQASRSQQFTLIDEVRVESTSPGQSRRLPSLHPVPRSQ